MVFAGNANPALAGNIARNIGVPLGNASISKFSDGEISVELNENVRGKDVFVIQPTCAPTNDSIMELMLISDALHRASANRMVSTVGVNRVLTVDLHAEQIQGFFSIPVDNVYGSPVLTDDIERQRYENLLVVSPDIGGVVRARAVAKQLNVDLAIIDKRRPQANVAQVMHIIGDVENRCCLIVDDIVDTAGTLCKAADALKEHGASQVVAYCTHPVLSGAAIKNIENSSMDSLVVTDTIPLSEEGEQCPKIRQLSMAKLLAESIRRVSNEESISAMFDNT
jgi:ribose-phosphate pyrophosphokinase